MNFWLVKSEPSVYPFDQLIKDGETVWDGVRNYAARLHLRAMKKGDRVLFYHSNEGLCVVGIATVSKTAYQDPTTTDDWSAINLKPYKALKNPVTLSQMKAEKRLEKIPLITIGRLSVMPLKSEEFQLIVEMGS